MRPLQSFLSLRALRRPPVPPSVVVCGRPDRKDRLPQIVVSEPYKFLRSQWTRPPRSHSPKPFLPSSYPRPAIPRSRKSEVTSIYSSGTSQNSAPDCAELSVDCLRPTTSYLIPHHSLLRPSRPSPSTRSGPVSLCRPSQHPHHHVHSPSSLCADTPCKTSVWMSGTTTSRPRDRPSLLRSYRDSYNGTYTPIYYNGLLYVWGPPSRSSSPVVTVRFGL